MSKADQAGEIRAQKNVVRKYRTLGYDVLERPDGVRLPEFLHGMKPDIIARNEHDNVVIEIRRHAALRNSNTLVGLAERVSDHPDWRFELVVVDDAADASVTDFAAQRDRLTEKVRVAMSVDLFDLAYVYLTAIVGTILREIAHKNGIRPHDEADRHLAVRLGFKGILPEDLLERCMTAMAARNDLARLGSDPKTPSDAELTSLIDLCERLKTLV